MQVISGVTNGIAVMHRQTVVHVEHCASRDDDDEGHGRLIIQEIRSVEHGICPIAEFASPWLNSAAILAIRP